MTDALLHRGPDARGIWVDEGAGIAFGHRRLSIVDLSANGAQPMHSHCGRYVITYNGEIYNHLALRRELEAAGKAPAHWRGTSDTETLLEVIAQLGLRAALERSVGQFALAVWDRETRSLSLARDRFGEKPLYYGWASRPGAPLLLFGSELKALKAHPGFRNAVDPAAAAMFMRFGYVGAPYSIYDGTRKVMPGSIVTIRAGERGRKIVHEEAYWRIADVARAGVASPFATLQDGLDAVEAALTEAVAGQLVADVPVGAFLSGGIDSSTIVALGQKRSTRPLKTYTVGFDEAGFDEAPFAAAVARHLGTEHHEIRLKASAALEIIPKLPEMYCEPFADSSQVPTHLISRFARREVTVALSGDGGDELFGGYNRYFVAPAFWRWAGRAPRLARRAFASTAMLLSPDSWNAIGRVTGGAGAGATLGDKAYKLATRLRSVNNIDELFASLLMQFPLGGAPMRLPADHAGHADQRDWAAWLEAPEHRMMLVDSLTYLPDDIMTKVDRASMAVSLEARAPMLDHRVAAAAWRMPVHQHIKDGTGKRSLRGILYKYVPEALLKRPKVGFAMPVAAWLRGPLKEWASESLAPARIRSFGLLDEKRIGALWSQHMTGRRDWAVPLWHALMLQQWLSRDSAS